MSFYFVLFYEIKLNEIKWLAQLVYIYNVGLLLAQVSLDGYYM